MDLREKYKGFSKLSISDLEPLKSLVNLKVLDLSANGNITDISALKNLTNLAAVCIGSNAVIDYSPVRCLPGYKKDWEGGALVWHGVNPSDMLRWLIRKSWIADNMARSTALKVSQQIAYSFFFLPLRVFYEKACPRKEKSNLQYT